MTDTSHKDNAANNTKPISRRKFVISEAVVNFLLIIAGAILITFILQAMLNRSALVKQRANNELALQEVSSIMEKNVENTDSLTDIYHEGNFRTLEDIWKLFDEGLLGNIMHSEAATRSEIFEEISTKAGIPYLYLLSGDGRIVISPDPSLVGRNPATTPHMTQENLNRILSGNALGTDADEPELVRNQYGSYYFYSKSFEFEGTRYVLTSGVSTWTLDVKISSLKNVATVLSRMGVINDGFLFAISSEDDIFLYYNNDDTDVSGQNAFEAGLTEEVLKDGYSGIQTILGEEYYCTSKDIGNETVIVAAARLDNIYAHSRQVLFWSVAGLALVMVLCLVYATIVLNDTIRHDTFENDRVIISKAPGPFYFNRTVFSKVLPLILVGIIAVFLISYYSQTLLEITEGIDKSNVILQEVTARYDESLDSREIIEDYYNSRFLSTARIITFIVEETPEILNQVSDSYYSYFDENGNRQFMTDDEGNRLRSVGSSEILQKLCDENSIKSIYIYDENGRTIATNTDNWFFILSHDETSQSYPFLQVLEGKTDSYLQMPMTSDIGEDSQYFGVSFNYYTTTDRSGNTVYVSRYDFEKACERENVQGVRTAGGITKHRSLLQIEMDQKLAVSIMASTSSDYVLSTKMLADGAIIMFDTSRDHYCIYSPVRSSVGKTAEELGISPKAFSGEVYYGFNRINGTQYFMLFSYIDQGYIATAIPRTSMFTGRTVISLATSVVCLVLLTILLLTVSVYGEKEKSTYEMIRKIQPGEQADQTIFSIILPSGRIASTTMAQRRWDNSYIPWNERTPEMKLALILGWIMGIPIIMILLTVLRVGTAPASDSVLKYIITGGWDLSLNIFSITACIIVLSITVVLVHLFRIPVRLCTALLGARGETVGHLLLSVIKYGGSIGALFYCMYLVGIDSANLLASAGILSLVIGLGAQSLIKDIIAGIFIVFEGEFRVGDIVTINGFRGTVTDIGLRTTKIMGGGNIKIFNNSDISGVLNMTKAMSSASVTISMQYDQDVSHVEDIINSALPKLKEKNRQIIDGPTNIGITQLGNIRYAFTVTAGCSEKDVGSVTRFLNRELIEILYKNGIKGSKSAPSAAPASNDPEHREVEEKS